MYPSTTHPTFGIFVKNQVELLRGAGVDADVLAIQEAGKGKVKTLQKYGGWFLRSFVYLCRHRRKLSLTHAHYAFPTGVISLLAYKWFRIPYVVTVHGGDIDQMAKKSPRIKKLTESILQQAKAVIVVGERLQDEVVRNFGVQKNKVHVMSMGVDTSIFTMVDKHIVQQELQLSAHTKNILYVGNMIEAKGLLELVQAIYDMSVKGIDVKLVLIGSQKDEQFVHQLKALIIEKNMQNIVFLEPQNQKNLAKWMAASDVLALPSYHEGFGLVALEAMACGTKVVASDVGGLSFLLKDQAGLLIKPKNVSSLRDGLMEAVDEQSTYWNDEAAKEKVREHSYPIILNRLLKIYKDIEK